MNLAGFGAGRDQGTEPQGRAPIWSIGLYLRSLHPSFGVKAVLSHTWLDQASLNRGSIGVRELNTVLQTALNPVRPSEPAADRFGWRFQVREKVIQMENDYKKEVFNGDIGTIERIDPSEQEVSIRFDGRLVEYNFGELDQVSLAYAVTIHKAQGSEFAAVVIPVAMQH